MASIEEQRLRIAGDLGVPVALRVSRRARRVALRIDTARRHVELVLPRGASARAGLAFLAEKRQWVAARLAALPPRIPFVEGAVVPVLGVPCRITRTTDPAAPPVAIGGGEIRVRGEPSQVALRVRAHLVALARAELAARAGALAPQIGRTVTRVSVRDTRSRWGSCSARASLSFSWRLIFAPEPVLDYVVAHEVAHLVEMNHGARFWRLVDSLAPQRRAARDWLRQHRIELLSYG
jgi:predicted metal-dependent hydrolase